MASDTVTDGDSNSEQAETRKDFDAAVNMSATEIEHWLERDESREVGWKGADGKGDGESIGHASGREIVRIKSAKVSDFTQADYDHMRKVVGYVARHSKQRPADPEHSRWRYSLMNWGHDPMKKG
jgi:hypothetical protein